MGNFIDFAAIKEAVSIEQAASLVGLTLKPAGKQLRGACPACKGDDRALCVTPERQSYYCFKAQKGGDCISLVAHVEGIPVRDAAQFLLDQTAPQVRDATEPQKPERGTATKAQPAPFNPEAFRDRLTYTAEVEAQGISREIAERFGIGFCARGSLKGFVCYPITDGTETHYIGWNGTEFKMPKWQVAKVVAFKRPA